MFRFLTSHKRGEYSVKRGDVHLGFVTKIAHRVQGKTIVSGSFDGTSSPDASTSAQATRTSPGETSSSSSSSTVG